ncbi:MAG: DUF3800 domain-containing protein, partial [Phycisphaerales bacterium]|nr:DUF3800 domain-containing protein [Phycisphaerales bacterium]
ASAPPPSAPASPCSRPSPPPPPPSAPSKPSAPATGTSRRCRTTRSQASAPHPASTEPKHRQIKPPSGTRHYFVDEAGDLTLFNKRGAVLLGRDGVSRTFMVGVALVPDPPAARAALDALRSSLLADPYFRNVPSMQAQGGKTALCFHAKNDLPEVRREVFRLLPTLGIQVQVAIRRKTELVAEARLAQRRGDKLRADDCYDDLVKRLFKNLLHQGEHNEITFARRGKSDRQAALQTAIAKARRNFNAAWNADTAAPTNIRSSVPSQDAGLQAIDFYLWALQRLLETGEDRFFELLKPAFRLVMDLDDTRARPYGRWYSARDPLTMEKMKPLTS